ncbi:hypothetical protein KBX50_05155 [Micromonospora sp. C51]|uniref:hypothetical protein n=1 Tax=Micromonospora sp. C51 TaxID=2824879 RepID=UPI001B36A9B3|nr:hypothetical protein [Micromonospora sp. C51]MBQ1047846.1 hypothetical protein [Micromonospora sp. C51]
MASKSYPRPGYTSGSITPYEHELLTHRAMPDGLRGFPTDAAPVFADGTGTRIVRVRAGLVGTVRGTAWESGGTDFSLPQLASNTSGHTRIDLVVLRLSRTDYTVTETVITGTPAAQPVAPSLVRNTGSTGFFDHPLAEVRVAHNAGALAANTVTTRTWYVGSDGQIRCNPDTRPEHEAGRPWWEHTTGRYVVSTGSQGFVIGDNASTTLPLVTANWAAPVFNRLRKRNGWTSMTVTPQRVSGHLNSGQTSRLGTIPAGYRPMDDLEFTGSVVSTGAIVIGKITASSGAIDLTFWRGAASGDRCIDTNRYCNLQAVTWPVNY